MTAEDDRHRLRRQAVDRIRRRRDVRQERLEEVFQTLPEFLGPVLHVGGTVLSSLVGGMGGFGALAAASIISAATKKAKEMIETGEAEASHEVVEDIGELETLVELLEDSDHPQPGISDRGVSIDDVT